MRQQRLIATLLFLTWAATASNIIAATQTPVNATFDLPEIFSGDTSSLNGTGVFGDSFGVYANGVDQVQCFFGKDNANAVLFTYNSTSPPRTLTLTFNPSSAAWQASGLKNSFSTTVDFYLPSNSISYTSIKVGSTIQVRAHLDFFVGSTTFRLHYPSLAAQRMSANTWLISSDQADNTNPTAFYASPVSTLQTYRGGSQQVFGTVEMPVRFELVLQ